MGRNSYTGKVKIAKNSRHEASKEEKMRKTITRHNVKVSITDIQTEKNCNRRTALE